MLKNKKIEFTLDYFFDFKFLFFWCFSLSMKSVFEKLKTEVIETRKKNIIQSTGSQFPKIAYVVSFLSNTGTSYIKVEASNKGKSPRIFPAGSTTTV